MAGPKMLKFNIAFALIGIVGGFAGFFIFVFALENFHAGSWSLIAGIMASSVLHIHVLDLKGALADFYTKERLMFTGIFGIFMAVVTVIASVVYLVIAGVNHIPMLPVKDSLVLGAVQAFLAFKWSASLVYFSRKHHASVEHMRLID